MMERCVREHHTKLAVVGSYLFEMNFRLSKNDRTRDRMQHLLGFVRQVDQRMSCFQIACHDSERFFLAKLALAQSHDGRGISGVTREVIAPDSLHGKNLAFAEELSTSAN